MFADQVRTNDGVAALDRVIERFPNIVEEADSSSHRRIESQFRRHHPHDVPHFHRVTEDILTVTVAELQAAEGTSDFGRQSREFQFVVGIIARLADQQVHFRFGLAHDLLDPRRMNSPIVDQRFEGLARNFPPERIETGNHHDLRCVVDEDIDSDRRLQRTDVSPLAADDPALHLVVR